MSTIQNRARLLNCNLTRVLRVAVGSMTRIQEHRNTAGYMWMEDVKQIGIQKKIQDGMHGNS
jgi:hypothetical protein